MAPQYGEVRVDYITYTTGVVPNEGNATAYVSGLINNPTFSGNVIIEGDATIDGNLNVSGAINASGVVISGITGLFDAGTEALPSIAFALDPDTGIYNPATNEVGISTNGDERLRVDNTGNVGIGGTLPSAPNITLATGGAITAGTYNTVSIFRSATGNNIGYGTSTFPLVTSGVNNSAFGNAVLPVLTSGINNIGFGNSALALLTEGDNNIAVGVLASQQITTGDGNIAIGKQALRGNVSGSSNTIIGNEAGFFIEGSSNTILGSYKGTAADSTLNDTVIISAGTTERLRIDSTGNCNFTISTLTNNTSVEVLGFRDSSTNARGAGLRLARYQNAQNYGLGIYTSQGSNAEVVRVANTGDVLIGGTLPSAPNITLANDGDALFAGDVGIGTANPTRPLDVSTSTNRVAIFRSTTATANIELKDSSTTTTLAIGKTGDDLSLYSDDIKRLAVLSGGNVLIGGTLPSAPNITLANDGAITAAEDATINTLTVGRGSGNITSNTVVGNAAFADNTTGNNNTAIGRLALRFNTIGNNNAANGVSALQLNTEGNANTAMGRQALTANTTGTNNTGIGYRALYSNITGIRNAALGDKSGYYIEGSDNTILGAYQGTTADSTLSNTVIISAGQTERMRIDSTGSLLFGGTLPSSPNITLANDGAITAGTYNTLTVGLGGGSSTSNTAVGSAALESNTTGNSNTAVGRQALTTNTEGVSNTAVGRGALLNNTEGSSNSALGNNALYNNTTGEDNTAVGRNALLTNTEGSDNTAVGSNSLRNNDTGASNTAVGQNAGYYIEGDNNTILGAYQGTAADATLSDTVIISAGQTERARCYSTGIWNLGTSAPVYADNAAAKTGGLVDGDVYRKSDGTMMIVFT